MPLIPSHNTNNYCSNISTFPKLKEEIPLNNLLLKQQDKQVKSPSSNIKEIIKDIIPIKLKDDLSYCNQKLYNYYIIHPENCCYLIKQCFNNRLNWRESQHLSTHYYNFQWKDCSAGINYFKLSSDDNIFHQPVNPFEYHSALSNKANMFHNLMQYCEENNKEVFQYIPLTILFSLMMGQLYITH